MSLFIIQDLINKEMQKSHDMVGVIMVHVWQWFVDVATFQCQIAIDTIDSLFGNRPWHFISLYSF